ncbi:hypothetical protein O3G_MSEX014108 [Manduca sexta]|uniref:Uncharacterized protein n=1 Tax=Manduca sexta TaxID=7130 RepID=A0A921ZVA8_MANSE|nr:hypothetical protein O3G_MSEX014108 [Manduca sexta]
MSTFLDSEAILYGNEQWMKLEEDWKPVDLETEEDSTTNAYHSFGSLDSRKTTFDSSFLFKKVRRKVGRQLSKTSALDYQHFIEDLHKKSEREEKQFYFINGQIISAVSVEEICDRIDDMFKSIEELCSANTKGVKGRKLPDRVECSVSTGNLSFDDTVESSKGRAKSLDKYIDEAFDQLSYTVSTCSCEDEGTRESVTTLVRKFSSILKSPSGNCSPRRQKQRSERFKELADFWNSRVNECE